MEITGKIISFLQEQRGTSTRGEWVRGGFVIETDSEYPKKIAFQAFGEDRISMYKNIQLGTPVKVTFSIESREYPAGSNKWFTNSNCIIVDCLYNQSNSSTQNVQKAPMPNATINLPNQSINTPTKDDDLPF